MAKTELTKKLELKIFRETGAAGAGIYGAFEVCFGAGYGDEYVDYVTMSSTGEIRCYEIKITKSDFHSKAKLSFYGDYNYLVMPEDLYNEVKSEIKNLDNRLGVYTYKDGYLTLTRKPKKKTIPPWQRYMVAHCMVRSLSRLTTKLVREREADEQSKR